MSLFITDGKKVTSVVLEGAIEVFSLSELGPLAVDGSVCFLVDNGKLVRCDTYYPTYIYV
jgi:hypothetical protein